MFPSVARSASGNDVTPSPKYSTNFPTTPVLRRISVTVSTRSVAVAPSRSEPLSLKPTTCGTSIERACRPRAAHLEADDRGDDHRERLPEHRRLRLDPAGAPAEHAEPVDHRRV